jgi:hypothetical protein
VLAIFTLLLEVYVIETPIQVRRIPRSRRYSEFESAFPFSLERTRAFGRETRLIAMDQEQVISEPSARIGFCEKVGKRERKENLIVSY